MEESASQASSSGIGERSKENILGQLIDWHIHSYHSDGTYAPKDILDLAKNRGIYTAPADHDTTTHLTTEFDFADDKSCGRGNLFQYAERVGIRFCPAIELSTVGSGISAVHLLGYNLPHDQEKLEELEEKLKETQEQRTKRTEKRIEKAHRLGEWKDITMEDLWVNNPHSTYLGFSHVAEALYRKGHYESIKKAYEEVKKLRWWKEIPEFYTHFPEQGILLLQKFGADVSVAHLARLRLWEQSIENEERFLRKLISAGLVAIEAVSPRLDDKQIVRYLYWSKKYDLKISVGSDYHSIDNTPVEIGIDLDQILRDDMLAAAGISREEVGERLLLK